MSFLRFVPLYSELTLNVWLTLSELPCIITGPQHVSGRGSSSELERSSGRICSIITRMYKRRLQGALTMCRLPPIFPWRPFILHLMGLYLIALCIGVIGLAACYSAEGGRGRVLATLR